MDKIKKEWIYISVIGAIWGITELFLGSILHIIKIPFKGAILTSIGFFLMFSLKKFVPKFGSIILSGIIVISFKLLAPNPNVLNIIQAIFLEIIAWEFILTFFKNQNIIWIISSIYTGTISSLNSLIFYIVFNGMNFKEAYNIVITQMVLIKKLIGYSLNPLLLYTIINIIITIVLFKFSIILGKKIEKRFKN